MFEMEGKIEFSVQTFTVHHPVYHSYWQLREDLARTVTNAINIGVDSVDSTD